MSRLTPEEVARNLSDFVNVMGDDKDVELVAEHVVNRTHRTLQQSIMGLFLKVIYKWAKNYEEGWYDGRNEATCKLAKSIVDHIGENYKYGLPLI